MTLGEIEQMYWVMNAIHHTEFGTVHIPQGFAEYKVYIHTPFSLISVKLSFRVSPRAFSKDVL